jgi:hypothetical protein
MPEASFSWIPVLATFQAVEHGAERPLACCFVFFEALRFARQACYASCQAGAAFRGEYAPAEEPVRVLEARVTLPAFENALEERVQGFCFLQGEPQLDVGLSWHLNGLSPGRFCLA